MSFIKSVLLSTVVLFSVIFSNGQLRMQGDNSFQDDMAKVIRNYPDHFKSLAGKLLNENPQSTDYISTIKVNGSEECSVTKFSAKKKEVYSWQALMLTTDDFETAKRRFKSLYSQLNNLAVRISDHKAFHLDGIYETPVEEKKFTSSIFSVNPGAEDIKNLKVELTMQFEFPEWKIRVLVYNREREDDERGETKEN